MYFKDWLDITKEDAKKHFNITDRRFSNYIKDNYIEKVETKKGDYYRLTDEGKNMSEKSWGFENHYNTQSIRHDYEITKKYLSLSPAQMETVKTERELRHEIVSYAEELRNSEDFQDRNLGDKIIEDLKNGSITCPDLSYSDEQGVHCFECITKNYSDEDISSKVSYCSTMGFSLEQVRV